MLSSQGALEESRLCLAQSHHKIIRSLRVIARSDGLIRALRTDLEPNEEKKPAG